MDGTSIGVIFYFDKVYKFDIFDYVNTCITFSTCMITKGFSRNHLISHLIRQLIR
jgi:hypothetical protein